MKIRRKCKCGCGKITNPSYKFIRYHHLKRREFSEEHKNKISLSLIGNSNSLGCKRSEETKLKISLGSIGNRRSKESKLRMSLAKQNQSKKTRLKLSLAKIKYHRNDEYCNIWRDLEYKKDIRKDYCENEDCKNDYKQLGNHHIYLNKKRCAPNDIMTLCKSCHMILHQRLQRKIRKKANPKHYIIINRPDHVSYIHKKSREIIKINRIKK